MVFVKFSTKYANNTQIVDSINYQFLLHTVSSFQKKKAS